MELVEDGEQVRCHRHRLARIVVVLLANVVLRDIPEDVPDALVDAESGLVPGVEGQEHGVVGEERDALVQESADLCRFVRVAGHDVVVEQPRLGLMQ